MWQKYEKAKETIELNQVKERADEEWDFYLGNQWKGLKTSYKADLPFHNIIMPIIDYKVSSIVQINISARYSDLKKRTQFDDVYNYLSESYNSVWEKGKMNARIREFVQGSAVTGNSYLYFGGDYSSPQIIQCGEILLGDTQQPDIQKQPFFIIRERVLVSKLKSMAKDNGINETDYETIMSDDETFQKNYSRSDAYISDDKATLIHYYTKENGVVMYGQATEHCEILPMQKICVKIGTDKVTDGTPLKLYPIVSMIWKTIPNSARGQGAVRGLIPNQISINQQIVRRDVAIKQFAFPKLAYDVNSITNPEDLDKVGEPIGIQGGTAKSINDIISYLQPSQLSLDAKTFNDDMINTTRDLAGATETNLGQIDPTRVANTTLTSLKEQSLVPLAEQAQKINQALEDIARLHIAMLIVYHPDGIDLTLEDRIEHINTETLEQLEPDVSVDITQNSPWSKQGETEQVDKLFDAGKITFDEYVELSTSSQIPQSKLKKIVEDRLLKAQQMAASGQSDEMAGGTNEMQNM